jgi:Helix-turn-helix domain/RodZ C-terminal domain
VDTGIGATLREARNRRKLDLSEVEAAIKIRPRFLRAMENEEWDVLPDEVYVRGFLRTYAAYLGLDGDRLAEEFKRATGGGLERVPKRVEPVPTGGRRRGPRLPGGVAVALVAAILIAVVVAIGLASGGGSSSSPDSTGAKKPQKAKKQATTVAAKPGVSLSLVADGEVWTCVLDATGEPVLEGQILEPGAEAGPYRSKGFTMAFGNGGVSLKVDGKQVSTPPSSSPVGYEVSAKGKLVPLEEGERPTCE